MTTDTTKRRYVMEYRVHKLDIRLNKDSDKLERFLNTLKGEVVSIVPNVQPTFMGMGATARVNFLLIVERIR